MRFSTVASLAVAAAPLASAAGTLGFALGTKKTDGSCKYTQDYEEDFDSIAKGSGSKLVRGYSASDCNFAQQILPAAKAKGFQVVLGVWPDVDASYQKDKAALDIAHQYPDQVYAITVGSEALYRGSMTAGALSDKIKDTKNTFPNLKVGFVDSWNKFADGTADPVLQSGVDIAMVNAFAYWQAQPIHNATATYFDDIMQAFNHIQTASGAKVPELWNGETGWPTDGGSNYGSGANAAIAGTDNAKSYFQNAVCGMLTWGVNVFYFEAFDEPWKPASKGDNGAVSDETHWGAMTAERVPKFNLGC